MKRSNIVSIGDVFIETPPQRLQERSMPDIPGLKSSGAIKTSSSLMFAALEESALFAASDMSILLQGESGVGKELFAEFIHKQSTRKSGRLVVINGAALPETLAEALLFGYEKGSFTGATGSKEGLIEAAEGGTVFLDEVGDIPLSIQTKLLRVVQSKVLLRVGSVVERKVDVRFVFASHKDIPTLVSQGAFREDLYYRIQEATISIPPLRERGEDAVLLAKLFAQKYGQEMLGRTVDVSEDAETALRGHAWPGNVRELQSTIRRAVVVSRGEPIHAQHLLLRSPVMPAAPSGRIPSGQNPSTSVGDSNGGESIPEVPSNLADSRRIEDLKRVQEALRSVNGNVSKAAELLGVSRPTIYNILRRSQTQTTMAG
jgi:transcriptional regulator with PAS, ATPase and Fis domain